jgi:hypothetical protein
MYADRSATTRFVVSEKSSRRDVLIGVGSRRVTSNPTAAQGPSSVFRRHFLRHNSRDNECSLGVKCRSGKRLRSGPQKTRRGIPIGAPRAITRRPESYGWTLKGA